MSQKRIRGFTLRLMIMKVPLSDVIEEDREEETFIPNRESLGSSSLIQRIPGCKGSEKSFIYTRRLEIIWILIPLQRKKRRDSVPWEQDWYYDTLVIQFIMRWGEVQKNWSIVRIDNICRILKNRIESKVEIHWQKTPRQNPRRTPGPEEDLGKYPGHEFWSGTLTVCSLTVAELNDNRSESGIDSIVMGLERMSLFGSSALPGPLPSSVTICLLILFRRLTGKTYLHYAKSSNGLLIT